MRAHGAVLRLGHTDGRRALRPRTQATEGIVKRGPFRRALGGVYGLMGPTGMKTMLALHKLWLDREPWPELVELPPGREILVLAPHFDDEAIGPGGTLAKHARAGHRLTVAFMTDGRRGD